VCRDHPWPWGDTPARHVARDPWTASGLAVLGVTHPAVVPVLADLARLENPGRALAHAVHGAVRMGLAQVHPPGGRRDSGGGGAERGSWFACLPPARAPPPPWHPAEGEGDPPRFIRRSRPCNRDSRRSRSVTGHLPHQAALGPCRPVGIRPEPAFRRPFPADEAVVIAAGEGSHEGQGQPCVQVCRHHTPPSRPHASCCFCSPESHVEPACAQSMRELLCFPSRPLPPCPNSSVHAPISVCNTPLHDHGIRAHLPDHQRLEQFSLDQTGLSR